MNAQTYSGFVEVKPKKKDKRNAAISQEDAFILATLEKLKRDLDNIRSSLDNITDPILIDSFIHEMNALNTRYTFYLRQCKSKGLVSKCLD